VLNLKKKDLEIQEMIPVSKPRDVYRNLDPLTEKVEIHGEKKYVGTSQDDVLYQRQLDKNH
jgi:hypothetical protein